MKVGREFFYDGIGGWLLALVGNFSDGKSGEKKGNIAGCCFIFVLGVVFDEFRV